MGHTDTFSHENPKRSSSGERRAKWTGVVTELTIENSDELDAVQEEIGERCKIKRVFEWLFVDFVSFDLKIERRHRGDAVFYFSPIFKRGIVKVLNLHGSFFFVSFTPAY